MPGNTASALKSQSLVESAGFADEVWVGFDNFGLHAWRGDLVYRHGVEPDVAGHLVLESICSGGDEADFLRCAVCRHPDSEGEFAPLTRAQKTPALPKYPGRWRLAKNDPVESTLGIEVVDTRFTRHPVGPRLQEQRLVDMPIRLLSTLEG